MCGIDPGSQHTELCWLDSVIAIETGSEANWVRRLLVELGHTVTVADAKRVKIITEGFVRQVSARVPERWLKTLAPMLAAIEAIRIDVAAA